MAEGGKSHRKKKSGRKAEKRKAAEGRKKGGGDGDMGGASTRAALTDDQARWKGLGEGRGCCGEVVACHSKICN